MTQYFEKFPLLYYPYGDNFKLATDILRRAKFSMKTMRTDSGTIPYTIQDNDTPDNVAARFYGASNLHWVVLLMNEYLNPYYDWPMSTINLQKFVTKKYGEGFEDDAHHYELVSTGDYVDIDDPLLLEDGEPLLLEDGPLAGQWLLTYNGQQFDEPVAVVTNRQYETSINEQKREIILLRPEFVNQAIAQLTTTIG